MQQKSCASCLKSDTDRSSQRCASKGITLASGCNGKGLRPNLWRSWGRERGEITSDVNHFLGFTLREDKNLTLTHILVFYVLRLSDCCATMLSAGERVPRWEVSVSEPIKICSSRTADRNTSPLPRNQPSTPSWRQGASRETLTVTLVCVCTQYMCMDFFPHWDLPGEKGSQGYTVCATSDAASWVTHPSARPRGPGATWEEDLTLEE